MMFKNPLPNADQMRALLNLPWTIQTGRTEHGDRFARCAEIPDAVAYAGDDEDLTALFWDCLQATLEAKITSGEPFAMPAGRVPPTMTVLVQVKGKTPEDVVTGTPLESDVSELPFATA